MADTPFCPICHRPADDSGRASCRCAEVEVLPRPVAQPDRGPDPADLAMFTEGARHADGDTAPLPLVTGGRPAPRRRIGRGLALAVGGTAVAVVGSGVLVAGLFTRGDDTFDEARFGDRGGAPTAVVPTDGKGEESAGADDSASPSASPSTTASPSPSASASPSQSRTPSSSPTPSRTAEAPTSTAPAPPPAPTTPDWDDRDGGWDGDGDGDGRPRTLREGDSGPEVAELQYRLASVGTYDAREHGLDGVYDGEVTDGVSTFQTWYGVRGDPEGVYGPHTRRALERATQRS
ncbi:peptidoglycan-binding domain-containing protein [Streptomyces radiopugnans]|uniref:Putative peptidoglycan binding domain-containing protein n=1 Tax=Streptomyces radiopugnans TaxID=403935 RepID=A0A1H8ZF55_9ACTN|nr:peptidoglycan-binding protein [Streptomyces radiopugnans]SEP63012.1 Putative peptidoglycan binding domain-containing protein [Streptomyces radiopugnans]